MKPLLTLQNRVNRLNFCLLFVNAHNSTYPFHSMMNTVHIDEKWFYIMKLRSRIIAAPGEI